MAATSLTLTQSGSGSTVISAQPGDTITVKLGAAVENDVLAAAVAGWQAFSNICGVTFLVDTAGTATNKIRFTQAGSATTDIDAEAGDTVTFELAAPNRDDVLQAAATYFGGLQNVTGVALATNLDGGS